MLAGGKVDKKLNLIKQCALAKKVASCILACINKNVASRFREAVILHYVTPVRPHSEYWAVFGNPQYKT